MSRLDYSRYLDPEIEPPRRRWSDRLAWLTLILAVCSGCFLGGVQWGTTAASEKWAARARRLYDLERHHLDQHRELAETRGQLWVKCPGSATWHNHDNVRVLENPVVIVHDGVEAIEAAR